MSSSHLKLVVRQFLLSFVFSVGLCGAASAQGPTVVYDWSSNSKVPEGAPKISRTQNVTFRIIKINDILFSYRLHVTQTPMEIDDFKKIAGFFNLVSPSAPKTGSAVCQTGEASLKAALQKASEALNADTALPVGYAAAKSHPSVSLAVSLAAWQQFHKEHISLVRAIANKYKQQCTGNNSNADLLLIYDDFEKSVEKIDNKADGPHVYEDKHDLSPGNDVSVEVVEMFGSETIATKTFSFPGTDILTLSAGALFSRIPDRTYESRKTPASDLNVLTVEGNSKTTPSIVALLNYSLGALRLDGETAGLALSAGPVIKLGAKSDASSFGFFTGISGHLYHRIYFTPGFHFGQFADFPVGFGNGSSIPANFGELTPVKRWTSRFALAITFKTKDFSGLTSSDTPKVTGDEAGNKEAPKPSSPSPSPSPSPENDSNSALSNLSLGMARDFLSPPRSVFRRASMSDSVVPQKSETNSEVSAVNSQAAPQDSLIESTIEFDAPIPTAAASHITSVGTRSTNSEDHILINASAALYEYSTYFQGGRLFLLIRNAKLDLIQDGLTGRAFTQPVFQRRGSDLILSFKLMPGSRVSILETASGLDVRLLSPTIN